VNYLTKPRLKYSITLVSLVAYTYLLISLSSILIN